MNSAPCGHLIERDGGSCMIGRSFPSECRMCAAYIAGLTEQEKLRHEHWQLVTPVTEHKIKFTEGAGHD